MLEFEDYELEDYDAELLNRGDYDAVLQLRENQLEKYPQDYRSRYRWAEVLELTKQYNESLNILVGLHQEEPEDEDTVDLILDCLRKTGQSPDEFRWKVKPKISYLSDYLIDLISKYVKGKRKNKRTITSVYLHFIISEYRPFYDEEGLYRYLKKSGRVHLHGEECYDAWIDKID